MQRDSLSRQNSYEERTSSRALSDLEDEDEEEVQAQAATTRNESPSAALPMDEGDLERGLHRRRTEPPSQPQAESLRDWAVGLLAQIPAPRRREEVDRDR
jgi:hypothetical protein